MIAKVLRSRGVPESAISIIPDEQEAIDAALHMGKQGDLLLIFADALARSWKQVTKFRPVAAPASAAAAAAPKTAKPINDASTAENDDQALSSDAALEAAGFVRDERGLRFVKESED